MREPNFSQFEEVPDNLADRAEKGDNPHLMKPSDFLTAFKEQEKGDAIADWPIEKIMRRLTREGKHLDQDCVYETLAAELPEEEIRGKIIGDYGVSTGKAMIDAMEERFGGDYVKLLIEPSISTRMDEFIDFAQTKMQEKGTMPFFDMRKEFKESLGKRKVYRVVSFTEAELESIKQDGFVANYYRRHPINDILQNTDGYKSVEYNLCNLVSRANIHAGGYASTKNSMMISASDYPEMAAFAAFVQLEEDWPQRHEQGQNLYLIPIEIDEFKNIRYGKYLPQHIEASGTWHSDQKDIPYNDPGVESFVEFRIPPENILLGEIKQIEPEMIPKFEYSDNKK